MLIKVRGGNKLQRALAEDIAAFMDETFTSKLTTLYVEIVIRKFNKSGEEGIAGWCCWEDDNVRPREFKVEASSELTRIDFIKTIIHEFVHVKQYALGEMKERFRGGHRVLWKEKDYSSTSYSKQPWEREAYKKQETLFYKYLER